MGLYALPNHALEIRSGRFQTVPKAGAKLIEVLEIIVQLNRNHNNEQRKIHNSI